VNYERPVLSSVKGDMQCYEATVDSDIVEFELHVRKGSMYPAHGGNERFWASAASGKWFIRRPVVEVIG
jgi:hypothetical protein